MVVSSPLRIVVTLLAVTFLSIASVSAATVAIIQADGSSFGRKHFCGFSSSATERISAFQYTGKKEKALVSNVKKLAPDLVFTLGEVPLESLVGALPSTPFIVGSYHAASVASKANVVLMESRLPIGAGLKLAHTLFPTRKTVGTVYNPRLSNDTFEGLVKLTGEMGMKLASLKVDTPADVKAFINAFAGKVDLLYWIRDSTTADEAALHEIYSFAKQNKVPVVSTDPSHLERGALLAVAVDPFLLGQQAWQTANTILKEGKIPQMPVSVSMKELVAFISLESSDGFGVEHQEFHHFLQGALKEGYNARILP